MTVVLDCNILVMCLTSGSPYHIIYQALVKGKFQLVVSNDILLEYEEIIQRKYSIATARAFGSLLDELPNVHYLHTYYQWQLITKDSDDNKYCDCAIAGQADYVVTEDRHFDVLKNVPFPSLTAVGINHFLEILQSV
jgi:putative PIN family toxin of toxin-antitoxin system